VPEPGPAAAWAAHCRPAALGATSPRAGFASRAASAGDRVGEVTCRAIRRCEPCSYLDGLLGQSALDALVHRGGIRAEVLTDGTITVGDPIIALPD
jgi:MOSC domain-containing protein YiiM